ncbi:MAG TPA: DUF4389 domain-containing protein [Solirubrobacterales bacterium]|nr:DUF4389 domain-containing protein [Solirubrobacterales bacterium]
MTTAEASNGERRPVRLLIADDLQRSRGTVFFRAIFALPFLIWLVVWAFGAAIIAFFHWLIALFDGKPSEDLHDFLARFIRFATHTYAYLNLAAEPLPKFDGRPGYPIDLEFDPPRPQNRWSIGFRLVLALPALFLASLLVGSGSFFFDLAQTSGGSTPLTVVGVAALFGWFYAMFRCRMPRGLRDLIAFALSYAAQAWAYLLLVSDRYPSSDPLTAIGPLPTRSDPVRAEVTDELRRSRLTVFFRLALAFPHLVWLTLWGILVAVLAIFNWFVTLIAGTSPQWVHRFFTRYVRYQLHVGAFLYLVGNPFPGFAGAAGSYPVELHVAERQRQNRWTVGFRLFLAIPALLLTSVFSQLLLVVAVFGWFVGLFTARMPLGLRNLGAFALRYSAQTYAYLLLLTEAYPYSGPCLEEAPAPPAPDPVPPAAPGSAAWAN